MHLYIYYDVRCGDVETVRERILAMRATLPDCSARLMRRPESQDGVETWMEIYENVDAGFEARLATAIDRHGLVALTGPRHVERFEDVA